MIGPYCKFCGRRCFVCLPRRIPDRILKAYGNTTIIATCRLGQEFEREKVGFCYDDIKEIIEDAPKAQAEEAKRD